MIDRIKELIGEAEAFTTDNKEALDVFRIKFISKKGLINEILDEFKNVPNEQKKALGHAINSLENTIENKIRNIQETVVAKEEAIGVYGDLARTGPSMNIGSRHPISLVKNQVIVVFSFIGFNVSAGPEIEVDWPNFEAL